MRDIQDWIQEHEVILMATLQVRVATRYAEKLDEAIDRTKEQLLKIDSGVSFSTIEYSKRLDKAVLFDSGHSAPYSEDSAKALLTLHWLDAMHEAALTDNFYFDKKRKEDE